MMKKKLNPVGIALELEDKIRIPYVYGNVSEVKISETIVANAFRIYYDAYGRVLDYMGVKTNRRILQNTRQCSFEIDSGVIWWGKVLFFTVHARKNSVWG